MARQLTYAELTAFRDEIAGQDGWGVTLISIDGEPADSCRPADEEAGK